MADVNDKGRQLKISHTQQHACVHKENSDARQIPEKKLIPRWKLTVVPVSFIAEPSDKLICLLFARCLEWLTIPVSMNNANY